MSFDIVNRLRQCADELVSEGYRITGRLGESVIALKHPNGNRMTLIISRGNIAYMKNGHLVKTDEVCRLQSAANPR